jgi:hypothetical protein
MEVRQLRAGGCDSWRAVSQIDAHSCQMGEMDHERRIR